MRRPVAERSAIVCSVGMSTDPLVASKAAPELDAAVAKDPDVKDKDNVVIIGETAAITLTAGIWSLFGLYVVNPREVRLILHNGRLTHIETYVARLKPPLSSPLTQPPLRVWTALVASDATSASRLDRSRRL